MNLTWLLVAVVYFGAVALAHRVIVSRADGEGPSAADEGRSFASLRMTAVPWRVAVLFYALVLAWLWRPMTGPYVNVPTDVVQLVSPWSAIAPPGLSKYTVSNYEMQDTVFQMTPWAHQVRESWKRLEPPLWNGLSGCGQPLLANMQSAGLSPLRLLALPLPLGYAMTAEAAMKILIALTFAFLYCRRRYDELPSVIGAIAFGFGTFAMVWLHFPHSTVAVFLPAVLYAIDLIAERATFGRIVFASFLGPMILFGGHPETTAHIVFFATVYALWVSRSLAFIRALATACLLASFLSAPLLFPFLESMRKTVRYQDLKERPHSDGTAYSDAHSLVAMIQPRFFGTRPGPAWSQNAVTESVCGFAGFLGVAAWFGLLVRVIARRDWRSAETFFVIAMFAVFVILDDWPYVSAPFRHLFSLALNSRMRLMFCFLAAVQTAALIHHARRERLPLYAALAGGAGTLLFLFAKLDFPGDDARRVSMMAIVPSVVVLAIMLIRKPVLIGAAIFVELWITSQHWNPVRPVSELYPKTPLIEALLRARGHQPYRIAGITGALFPNTHALFGLEDARVHDAMANARYAKALGTAMPYDPLEYYPKFKDPDAAILDDLNVKWLVTEPGVTLQDTARYTLLYNGPDGGLYENLRVKPRFTGAHVEILEAGNDRYTLRVDAPKESLIRASIAAWPGWRITYDGKTLDAGIVDHAFLAFVIPPGTGTVRIRYLPVSFWAGAAASLLTVLALAVRAGMRTA